MLTISEGKRRIYLNETARDAEAQRQVSILTIDPLIGKSAYRLESISLHDEWRGSPPAPFIDGREVIWKLAGAQAFPFNVVQLFLVTESKGFARDECCFVRVANDWSVRFQAPGKPQIIAIEKFHVFAICMGNPEVARRTWTLIWLREHAHSIAQCR